MPARIGRLTIGLLLGLSLPSTALAGSPARASDGGLPFNLILRTDQGDNVSSHGYTTGGAVIGIPFSGEANRYDNGLGFIDLRGHVENDGHPAVTSDLGYRIPDWDGNRIWGVHAGYDWRQTDNGNYGWVNIGAEMLSRDWDLRADGYINVSSDTILCNCADQFVGNELLLRQTTEEAMWGIEGAAGKHFMVFGDIPFYLGARVHYFSGDFGDPAAGGRLQLQADVLPNLSLGASGGYDSLFGALGYATITLSFGDVPRQPNRDLALQQRLIDPIQRQELVVVSTQDRTGVPFVDGSGMDVPFIHVDNTAPDGGDGSFEHRFNHLLQAQGASGPGDVIIVHKGDGTTTFYNQGITLQNNQYLLGAQFAGQLLVHGLPICFNGNFQRPTITNGAGDGVTLANNDTVAGLDIVNTTGNGTTTGNGIHGNGVTGGTFIDLSIDNTQLSGIRLDGAIGNFTFLQNTITRTGQINAAIPAEDRNSHFDAIDIHTMNGAMNIDVTGNQLNENIGDAVGIEGDGSGHIDAAVRANTMQNNGEGGLEVNLLPGSAGANLAVTGNLAAGNGQEGFSFYNFGGSGALTAVITGNTVAGNGAVILDQTPPFSDTEFGGIILFANSATTNASVFNNIVSDNYGPGIYVSGSAFNHAATMNVEIVGNTIDGNGIANNGDSAAGVVLFSSGLDPFASRIFANIHNNELSGNVRAGVYGFANLDSFGNDCVRMTNNTGTNNHIFDTVGPFNSVGLPYPGGGVIDLEPLSGNSGSTTLTGVTSVPAGTCGF